MPCCLRSYSNLSTNFTMSRTMPSLTLPLSDLGGRHLLRCQLSHHGLRRAGSRAALLPLPPPMRVHRRRHRHQRRDGASALSSLSLSLALSSLFSLLVHCACLAISLTSLLLHCCFTACRSALCWEVCLLLYVTSHSVADRSLPLFLFPVLFGPSFLPAKYVADLNQREHLEAVGKDFAALLMS